MPWILYKRQNYVFGLFMCLLCYSLISKRAQVCEIDAIERRKIWNVKFSRKALFKIMIICGTYIHIYQERTLQHTTLYQSYSDYFGQTWSISWLLVPRVNTSPSHHQRFHMRCERQKQNKMPIIIVCDRVTLEITWYMRLLLKYISSWLVPTLIQLLLGSMENVLQTAHQYYRHCITIGMGSKGFQLIY